MASCAEKHHACKVGMGESRDTTSTGGGRKNILANFYRAVVQAILLYGLETWVLLESMEKRKEGKHTELLRIITGKRANQL